MRLKNLFIALVALGFYFFPAQSLAQVTTSSHPEIVVEACASFPSQAIAVPYTLTLTETNTDDFAIGSSVSFKLALPSNFTYSGTVAVTSSGADISSITAIIDDDTHILVSYTTTATATTNVISLSGFSIVASTAAQSGNLTYLAGTAVMTTLLTGAVFFPVSSAAAALTVTGGTTNATATYCLDEVPAFLNVTAGTNSGTTSNTLTYQWESSVNNATFTPITGQTGLTYQPSAATVGVTYYRRKIAETSNGVSCIAYSSSVSITIKTLDAGEIAGDQNICSASTPAAISSVRDASVAGEVITYDWQKSINDGVSWTTACSDNSTTLNFGSATLTQTTQFRRIAFSTSCTVTKSTNIITKTVFGPIDGGTITPSTQLVYKGITPASLTVSTTTTTASVSGTLSYQWQQSTDEISYSDIENATGASFQPIGTQTGTLYFK